MNDAVAPHGPGSAGEVVLKAWGAALLARGVEAVLQLFEG
jgi:hypothetical protein